MKLLVYLLLAAALPLYCYGLDTSSLINQIFNAVMNPSSHLTGSKHTDKPSKKVLREKSLADNLVEFSVHQIIDGISLTEYEEDTSNNRLTIAEAGASCMAEVTTSDMTNFVAEYNSDDSIIVDYKVSVTDSDDSYAIISTELDNCVASGQFNTFMHSYANENNAENLETATCAFVQTESLTPTAEPTMEPSPEPSTEPTIEPTAELTVEPTIEPTVVGTVPTTEPSTEPTMEPTTEPTAGGTAPTHEPTTEPTPEPTIQPTMEPTVEPTIAATGIFNTTISPTVFPSQQPTFINETLEPSLLPTTAPTSPTIAPSAVPTTTRPSVPPDTPTYLPTTMPTVLPTVQTTFNPTLNPSTQPSALPTVAQTAVPSVNPTIGPTAVPSFVRTTHPTITPGDPTPSPTFFPTIYPTIKPSKTPTISPTKNDLIEFSAVQTISGVSIDEYNQDPDAYDETLTESIADTMEGVDSDDIQDLQVTAGSSTDRRLTVDNRRRLQDSIETTYTVVVRDPDQSYESLSSQLSDAVTSGQFNTILQTNAVANGATGLEDATSDSVTTTNLLADSGSKKKKDEDDDGLSDGAIAGIVIGVLAGVIIIGAIAYFVMNKSGGHERGYRDSYMERGLSEIATTPLTEGRNNRYD